MAISRRELMLSSGALHSRLLLRVLAAIPLRGRFPRGQGLTATMAGCARSSRHPGILDL